MNIRKLGMTVVTMLAITATGTCFAVSKEDFVIGNIRLGQPITEVIAEYSRYYFVKEGNAKWFLVDTAPTDDKSVLCVALNGDVKMATKAGIKVGSTGAEVKNAYGEPDSCLDVNNNRIATDDKNYQGPCIVSYEADGLSLQFVLSEGKDAKERKVMSIAMREMFCGRGGIGRRTRLRIWRFIHAGSSPVARTKLLEYSRNRKEPAFLQDGAAVFYSAPF